jgi:hypothetical protein
MFREYLFLGASVVGMALLLIFGQPLGFALQGILRGSYLPLTPAPQIATLEARLEGYGEIRTVAALAGGIKAAVYSRYPFNFKNEILIAAGDKQGIKVGDTALFQGSILGVVLKVFDNSALVETVFDSRFRTPVRVGLSGTEALLVGGNQPTLQLIPPDAPVENSDHAYSAAEGMPYGVRIGAVERVRDAKDGNYKEADLRVPYNPASLSEVVVVPKEQ